jgi:hypothetical protein
MKIHAFCQFPGEGLGRIEPILAQGGHTIQYRHVYKPTGVPAADLRCGETFNLPAGAEWLAWYGGCRNQVFRLSRRIYGLQFHQDAGCRAGRELTEQAEPAGRIFGAWARLIAE